MRIKARQRDAETMWDEGARRVDTPEKGLLHVATVDAPNGDGNVIAPMPCVAEWSG
jgi:hypothetical protein